MSSGRSAENLGPRYLPVGESVRAVPTPREAGGLMVMAVPGQSNARRPASTTARPKGLASSARRSQPLSPRAA